MSGESGQTVRWTGVIDEGDALSERPTFEEAEFYGSSYLVEVVGEHTVIVESTGDPLFENRGTATELRTPSEFRAAFPDGRLPDDSEEDWEILSNGWFQVLVVGQDEWEQEPCFALSEAVALAKRLAGHLRVVVPRAQSGASVGSVAEAMNRR